MFSNRECIPNLVTHEALHILLKTPRASKRSPEPHATPGTMLFYFNYDQNIQGQALRKHYSEAKSSLGQSLRQEPLRAYLDAGL